MADIMGRADELLKQNMNNSAAGISSADDVISYLQKYAKTDAASRDMLFNYYLTEKSTASARKWEEEQNAKRYQVMVDDLKKAGINPYWLGSLGGAASYQGQQSKYSGSAYETSYRDKNTSDKAVAQTLIQSAGSIMSALMLVLALV